MLSASGEVSRFVGVSPMSLLCLTKEGSGSVMLQFWLDPLLAAGGGKQSVNWGWGCQTAAKGAENMQRVQEDGRQIQGKFGTHRRRG